LPRIYALFLTGLWFEVLLAAIVFLAVLLVLLVLCRELKFMVAGW